MMLSKLEAAARVSGIFGFAHAPGDAEELRSFAEPVARDCTSHPNVCTSFLKGSSSKALRKGHFHRGQSDLRLQLQTQAEGRRGGPTRGQDPSSIAQ